MKTMIGNDDQTEVFRKKGDAIEAVIKIIDKIERGCLRCDHFLTYKTSLMLKEVTRMIKEDHLVGAGCALGSLIVTHEEDYQRELGGADSMIRGMHLVRENLAKIYFHDACRGEVKKWGDVVMDIHKKCDDQARKLSGGKTVH